MYKVEDYQHVFDYLNIASHRAVSLYKYAPVFKVRINDQFFVLKKTKKDEMQVSKLLVFEKHLASNNIPVVIPIKRFDEETHLVNEERWVLYPFVEGAPYNGSVDHIRKAGDLLGKIHASNNHVFNHGFTWKNFEDVFLTDIIDDLNTIEAKYGEQVKLRVLVEDAIKNKFESLKTKDLPFVDATWDYKASNLIYNNDIMLIDLDNSGYIPRILDLGLALLLFHTETPLAPNRPFNQEEWKLFLEAYSKHIELEPVEVECFNEFLKFVFLDEAVYAIVDLEDDEPVRQNEFIENLLAMDLDEYHLY
ncbi:MAG: phosphotransferase [Clostridiales bacterium]|nr:phosphotransferase [Clostridiales bacterium]